MSTTAAYGCDQKADFALACLSSTADPQLARLTEDVLRNHGVGPFEYAFCIEASRLQGNHKKPSPPVNPEIACTSQAVQETLMGMGLDAANTAEILRLIATRIHDLEPQLNEQRRMRRVERQLRQAIRKR